MEKTYEQASDAPLFIGKPYLSFGGGSTLMITPVTGEGIFCTTGTTFNLAAQNAAGGLLWRVMILGKGSFTARTPDGNKCQIAAQILRQARRLEDLPAADTHTPQTQPILRNNAYQIGVLSVLKACGGDIAEASKRTGVSANTIKALAEAEDPVQYIKDLYK